MILSGNPLNNNDKKRLKDFLKKMDLEYDESIEYSVCILNEENEIIGTGSVDRNVLKCIAIDATYQGQGLAATILSELIQYEFEHGRTHIFIYTKPHNRAMFSDMGFYTILQTEEILFMENRRGGLEKFIQKIKGEMMEERRGIQGAIVANCNPFTLGHRYLIEQALEKCDLLHLFLLSDDRSTFTPKERYEMLCRGTHGLERIVFHWTEDYMVSAATFPTYFFKDKAQGQKANCRLDLELFAKRIAPALGITRRFVGTEPNCSITGMYNQEMKAILPQHGIEVMEMERKTMAGIPISASLVRKDILAGNLEMVRTMVPEQVYEYLKDNVR